VSAGRVLRPEFISRYLTQHKLSRLLVVVSLATSRHVTDLSPGYVWATKDLLRQRSAAFVGPRCLCVLASLRLRAISNLLVGFLQFVSPAATSTSIFWDTRPCVIRQANTPYSTAVMSNKRAPQRLLPPACPGLSKITFSCQRHTVK
jgi:hypothetical protein